MDNTRALTGVRFFFALMVVCYHLTPVDGYLGLAGVADGPSWLWHLLHAGHAGVQFFFVLSGFILALTYHDLTPERVQAFYLARVARIVPIYLLGVVVMVPAASLMVFKIDQSGMNPWLNLAIQAVLWLTFLQAWFPRWALSGNFPGWSLSAEAFFYACFPRLIATLRHRGSIMLAALAVTLIVLELTTSALGWTWSGLSFSDAQERPFGGALSWWADLWCLNPLLHLPEFILGMITYLLLKRGVFTSSMQPWMVWVGGLIVLGVMVSGALPHVLLNNGSLAIPAAAMIVGLTRDSLVSRALGSAVLQLLGQASYSMYLLHISILWYFVCLDQRVLHLGGSHPLVMAGIYVGLVIGVSVAAFLWIEEPMRRWIKARTSPRPVQAPS
ncbi:MAG TPA: acyltransferase [Planctomycetota bacterium]|nr:acyltransferase [Planctomycetota bacterium]